jgi:hypothetical protein
MPNGKKIFRTTLLAGMVWIFALAAPLAAAEKSFELTIPGCTAWGPFARISSILKGKDGIIRFMSPAQNRMRITFDDGKTDPEAITQALVQGGVAIPGRSTPETERLYPHP